MRDNEIMTISVADVVETLKKMDTGMLADEAYYRFASELTGKSIDALAEMVYKEEW